MSKNRRAPSQKERDEKVRLDLPLTFEEAARVLVAVNPTLLSEPEKESDTSAEDTTHDRRN